MKKIIIFSTAYPYAAGVVALVWVSSSVLMSIDDSLPLNTVLTGNVAISLLVALIGFRK